MDIITYEGLCKPLDSYKRVKVSSLVFDATEVVVEGVNYKLSDELFTTLCRFVGMPKGLTRELMEIDTVLWSDLVKTLYKHHYDDEVVMRFIYDQLLGISNYEKDPLGHKEFIDRTISFFDDIKGCQVEDIEYVPHGTHSSVIVLNDEIHNYRGLKDFKIGSFIENDALYGVHVKLVIKDLTNNTFIYGVPALYKLSSARYNKTTSTGREAYDNLLITMSELMAGKEFKFSMQDRLDSAFYQEDNVHLTYEEFYRVKLYIMRACTLSLFDEDTIKHEVERLHLQFDFNTHYHLIQESDYIWRTTAYSDKYLTTARSYLSEFANNQNLRYESRRDLRSLAGELLFGRPVYRSIAIRK